MPTLSLPASPSPAHRHAPAKSRFASWRRLAALALAASALPAFAVNRDVHITAPPAAVTGSTINITTSASTDATDGEQIGFFHAEFSTNNGASWTGICFDENTGASTEHSTTLKAGPVGSTVLVRLRIAFRGGKARDVDFNGKAIDWEGSWTKWGQPPAKFSRIPITAPPNIIPGL